MINNEVRGVYQSYFKDKMLKQKKCECRYIHNRNLNKWFYIISANSSASITYFYVG